MSRTIPAGGKSARILEALVVVVVLGFATPARAIRCSEWTRLDPGGRDAALQQIAADAPNHPSLRGRQVHATRLQMCLGRVQYWMAADFDEACSRGRSADLQVLNQIVRHYIGTCTSGRGGYR